ncbi:MAG: glycosyltransferase [Cyanobacteriota bacterium]|nr:glycosyltransferase [Cyanobacteriota bacterium]
MTTEGSRRRILLAIGDVGAGHRIPATVIKQAILERFGDAHDVVIDDFFALVDPSPLGDSNGAQRLFAQYGLLKRLINDPVWHIGNTPLGHRITERYLLSRTLGPYAARLEHLAPDLVVSIHPYLSITLAAIRRQGGAFRYAVVVTDLACLLRGWADPQADLIVSPTEEACRALQAYGIDRSRVLAPLFPLTQGLGQIAPREDTLGRLGLNPALTTLLFSGGGSGARAFLRPLARLAQQPGRQLIIATGKDEALAGILRERFRGTTGIRILNFVPNLPEYFAAADLVITKPGTSTVLELEALAKRTVLSGDLGPQELGNVRYALKRPLVRHIGSDWRKLEATISELLAEPASNTAPGRHRNDAITIAERLVNLLQPGSAAHPHGRQSTAGGPPAAGPPVPAARPFPNPWADG